MFRVLARLDKIIGGATPVGQVYGGGGRGGGVRGGRGGRGRNTKVKKKEKLIKYVIKIKSF